jgi:hypothetical protein
MVMQALKQHGQGCYDVRSREIKNQFPSDTDARARLFVRSYRANHGTELFISVELPNKGATHQVPRSLHVVTHGVRLRIGPVPAHPPTAPARSPAGCAPSHSVREVVKSTLTTSRPRFASRRVAFHVAIVSKEPTAHSYIRFALNGEPRTGPPASDTDETESPLKLLGLPLHPSAWRAAGDGRGAGGVCAVATVTTRTTPSSWGCCGCA